ncbi:MAG: MFS transporter [Legionellales bacterium]|nr:MAG: MFS transporter [Legionellales bacterium]
MSIESMLRLCYLLSNLAEHYSMNRTEILVTFGVAMTFALRMLGLFMVLPVLGSHFVDLALVGVALGVYGLLQAILQIPLGMLSDRLGRKKIILIGLLLFILGSGIAGCYNNIYGVIIGRALQGSAAIGCVLLALMADVVREQFRARAMAIIGIGIALSFVIAMVVGPVLYAHFGLATIFYVMSILGGIALLLMYCLPISSTQQVNYLNNNIIDNLLPVLHNKNLLLCNFGVMLLHALLAAWFVVLPLKLQNYSIGVYASIICLSFLIAIILLQYSNRNNRLFKFIIINIILLLVAQVLLWLWADIGYILLFSVTIFMVAFNFLEANLPMLVTKFAPPSNRGAALGVHSSMQFFGTFVGGVCGGLL